jgi:hypothetical protein
MPRALTNRRLALNQFLFIAGSSLSVVVGSASMAQPAANPPQCKPSGALVRVNGLTEGSGVAASRKAPGRFWAHNDSGEPVLLALDEKGAVTGRVTLSGAKVEDWEAIAVGPCPAGSCIYVGDIGDNDAHRRQVTVYRIPEPAEANGTAKFDVFHATYPDGAHDAEALLMTSDGRLHIVTKGETGAVGIYRFPAKLEPSSTAKLERVGQARAVGTAGRNDRITDASVSPDGEWAALRSVNAVMLYRTSDLLAGNWREAARVAVDSLGEPQGEGITFGDANSVYLVGEGGGKKQPGTFARLSCTLGTDR